MSDDFAASSPVQQSGKLANLGAGWTVDEEQQLYDGFSVRADIGPLVTRHGRSPGGIRSRLVALALLDENEQAISPKAGIYAHRRHATSSCQVLAPGPGIACVETQDTDALFLALLARLGPSRRGVAMEVLRALVAFEVAADDAARVGVDERDDRA